MFSVRVQPVGGGRPVHGLVVDETDSTYAVEFTPFKWVAQALFTVALRCSPLRSVRGTI